MNGASQGKVERCDFIDVLEEAAVLRSAVTVRLKGGESFTDHVRDVITEHGEDYAIFRAHARVSVTEIGDASRLESAQSLD